MPFFPGMLSQFFSMGLFWIIILVAGYMGTKIWWQKIEISHLKTVVQECKLEQEQIDLSKEKTEDKIKDCQKNIKLLNNYYRQPRPSIVKNGTLDTSKLFMRPR